MDKYCATTFFFHNHSFELELIKQALMSPAFYVGALGSKKTHLSRLKQL
ncbi:XdhC family protein [Cognatishimia maritima]